MPIPALARPVGKRPRLDGTAGSPVPFYQLAMREFRCALHRDLPPTALWGYAGTFPGPTFEARRGEPLIVEWRNDLPSRHLFPVDHSLDGAGASKPDVRTVVHLHGGRTPPQFDGYPELWFTPGHSFTSYYPNNQEAATLFYHDHAMGITRLNTLAGLMGLYLVRDDHEAQLGLPDGRYEVPLIFCDRTFTTDGQIYYPAHWISDYIGSTILVNGKIAPFLEVEPRPYRFRVVNTSNGGFYFLSLAKEGAPPSDAEPFWQIGSDQGFLAAPVPLHKVFLGPGERADLLIDFAPFAGKNVEVHAQAAVALQFRVALASSSRPAVSPPALRPVERIPGASAIKTRVLTLGDDQDRIGHSHKMLLNGQHWHMPVSERPKLDTTEIWTFVNLTDDTHPIHLHLVRFQILDRGPFDAQVFLLTRQLEWTGPVEPLDENEMGWKDTVRCPPTLVTRIIVKFEGYPGRYVWHCHVLEHEDNEMMRPYDIVEA